MNLLIAMGIGVSLDVVVVLPAMALVLLASLVLVSIGGWGVREGASVLVFGLIGISPPDGLAISILYGIGTLAIGMLGGLVWLLSSYKDREKNNKRPREVSQ